MGNIPHVVYRKCNATVSVAVSDNECDYVCKSDTVSFCQRDFEAVSVVGSVAYRLSFVVHNLIQSWTTAENTICF